MSAVSTLATSVSSIHKQKLAAGHMVQSLKMIPSLLNYCLSAWIFASFILIYFNYYNVILLNGLFDFSIALEHSFPTTLHEHEDKAHHF